MRVAVGTSLTISTSRRYWRGVLKTMGAWWRWQQRRWAPCFRALTSFRTQGTPTTMRSHTCSHKSQHAPLCVCACRFPWASCSSECASTFFETKIRYAALLRAIQEVICEHWQPHKVTASMLRFDRIILLAGSCWSYVWLLATPD